MNLTTSPVVGKRGQEKMAQQLKMAADLEIGCVCYDEHWCIACSPLGDQQKTG